jgi:hypothetical protein
MAKEPKATAAPVTGEVPEQENKGGRPSHQPTEQARATVRLMAGHFLSRDDIAIVIGINKTTLEKHYAEELAVVRSGYKLEVARAVGIHLMGRPAQYNAQGRLIREEIKPDRTMAIFQAKVVLGQQEVSKVVHVLSPEQMALLDDDEFRLYARIIEKVSAAEFGSGSSRESKTSH